MNNKELQDLLKQYPDDLPVIFGNYEYSEISEVETDVRFTCEEDDSCSSETVIVIY